MPKDYNQLFKSGPLAFMQKYAVMPSNHIGSHGATIGDLNDKGQVKQFYKFETYEYNKMGAGNLVGYLNFTKVAHDAAAAVSSGQVAVTGSYTPDNTAVEAYFLPWYDQKIISLNIPPMPTYGGGTKIFFTAAINGCSVFFKGTPESPTIFHAGGKTVKPGSDPSQGAAFWRKMLQTRTETKTGKLRGEVNKTMYITDRKDKAEGTANSRLFDDWLRQNPNGFQIEDIAPHACVFGLRDSGAWTFYLQENVTIWYTSFTLQPDGSMLQRKRVANRPMQVTEVFPNGKKHVQVTPMMSRALKG